MQLHNFFRCLFIEPGPFPLSDATALLMRLQMEPTPIGIDFKDRWRELGIMYQNLLETMPPSMYIFYDFHALLGCLYGNERYDVISANLKELNFNFPT